MVLVIKMAEQEVNTVAGVDIKGLVYTSENVEFSKNNKEEFEIVNGAFLGNYAYEERKALRDLKLAKIIDMF